jgi:hypothetical protein
MRGHQIPKVTAWMLIEISQSGFVDQTSCDLMWPYASPSYFLLHSLFGVTPSKHHRRSVHGRLLKLRSAGAEQAPTTTSWQSANVRSCGTLRTISLLPRQSPAIEISASLIRCLNDL